MQVLGIIGDLDDAINHLRKAVELSPDEKVSACVSITIHFNLAFFLGY